MLIQILIGSIISPASQLKARSTLKESYMDFLPNLIKQGKFIDTVSGLTIFINEKVNNNAFRNIFIQEGDLFDLNKENNKLKLKEEELKLKEKELKNKDEQYKIENKRLIKKDEDLGLIDKDLRSKEKELKLKSDEQYRKDIDIRYKI